MDKGIFSNQSGLACTQIVLFMIGSMIISAAATPLIPYVENACNHTSYGIQHVLWPAGLQL